MLMCPKSKKGRWILERQVALSARQKCWCWWWLHEVSLPRHQHVEGSTEECSLSALLPAGLPSVPVDVVCIVLALPSQVAQCEAGGMLCTGARGLTCWRKLGVRVTFHLHLQRADIHYGEKKRLYDSAALRTQPGQWRQQWDFSKLQSNLATRIYFLF